MAKQSKGKKPPKGSAVPPDPYADLKKNEQGKFISWRAGTPAADMLKVLVQGGSLDGMTAGQIQKHPMYKEAFGLWDNNCFSSALTNMRKSFNKEIETARGKGSEGRSLSTVVIVVVIFFRIPIADFFFFHSTLQLFAPTRHLPPLQKTNPTSPRKTLRSRISRMRSLKSVWGNSRTTRARLAFGPPCLPDSVVPALLPNS